MPFKIPDNIPVVLEPLPPIILPDEKRPSLLDEGDTLRIDHPTDQERWMTATMLEGGVVDAKCYAGGELVKTLQFYPAIKADYCLQENLEGWHSLG